MKRIILNQIPNEILNDTRLIEATAILPKNYNFEVPKTIWKIRNSNSKRGNNLFLIYFFFLNFINIF
jgi:2-(3-amino-3-carboxypropyl)histidine synthase